MYQRVVTRRKLVPVTKTENVTRVASVPGCCEDRPPRDYRVIDSCKYG